MVRLWALGGKANDLCQEGKLRRREGAPQEKKNRKLKQNRRKTGYNGWTEYIKVIDETENGEVGRWMTWEEFFAEEEAQRKVKQEETNIMSRICDAAMPGDRTKNTFWWNENTEKVGRESRRARRLFQRSQTRRSRGKCSSSQYEELYRNYREARQVKQFIFRKAKDEAWQQLLSEIDDDDPCIKPFKLLLSNVKLPLVSSRNANFLQQVEGKLSPDVVFPMRNSTNKVTVLNQTPDIILNRVLRLLQGILGDSTELFELCLKRSNFPEIWKLALLVVLSKDGIPSVLPLAYQPIPLSSEFESDILFQIMCHTNSVVDSVVQPKVCWVVWKCVYHSLQRHGVPQQLIYLLEEYVRSHYLVKEMCFVPKNAILYPLFGLLDNSTVKLFPEV